MNAPLPSIGPARLEAIELAAAFAQRIGFTRTIGQVYGLIFTASSPLSLDVIAEELTLSKTSVSTAVRELLSLSAIRQVWPPGERKDHFEARTDFREVLKANYLSTIKPPFERAESRLDALLTRFDADLQSGQISPESHAVTSARLTHLRSVQAQLRQLLPLLEELL